MTKLQSPDFQSQGIKCDLCGGEHRTRFDYFQFELFSYLVRTGANLRAAPKIVDICPGCFDSRFRPAIIKHNAAPKKQKFCDLSGAVLKVDGYYAKVASAKVMLDDSTTTCNKCRAIVAGKQCKCGSTALSTQATMVADDKFLELYLTIDVGDGLLQGEARW